MTTTTTTTTGKDMNDMFEKRLFERETRSTSKPYVFQRCKRKCVDNKEEEEDDDNDPHKHRHVLYFKWSNVPKDVQQVVCHFLKMSDFLSLALVNKNCQSLVTSKPSQRYLQLSIDRFPSFDYSNLLRGKPIFFMGGSNSRSAIKVTSLTGLLNSPKSIFSSPHTLVLGETHQNMFIQIEILESMKKIIFLHNTSSGFFTLDHSAGYNVQSLVFNRVQLFHVMTLKPMHVPTITCFNSRVHPIRLLEMFSPKNFIMQITYPERFESFMHQRTYQYSSPQRLEFLYMDTREDGFQRTFDSLRNDISHVTRLVLSSHEYLKKDYNFCALVYLTSLRMLAICSLHTIYPEDDDDDCSDEGEGNKENRNPNRNRGKSIKKPILPQITHLYDWGARSGLRMKLLTSCPNLEYFVADNSSKTIPIFLEAILPSKCPKIKRSYLDRILPPFRPSLTQFLSMPLNSQEEEEEEPEKFQWLIPTMKENIPPGDSIFSEAEHF